MNDIGSRALESQNLSKNIFWDFWEKAETWLIQSLLIVGKMPRREGMEHFSAEKF